MVWESCGLGAIKWWSTRRQCNIPGRKHTTQGRRQQKTNIICINNGQYPSAAVRMSPTSYGRAATSCDGPFYISADLFQTKHASRTQFMRKSAAYEGDECRSSADVLEPESGDPARTTRRTLIPDGRRHAHRSRSRDIETDKLTGSPRVAGRARASCPCSKTGSHTTGC